MTLNLKHFDTRTGQWITLPNPSAEARQKNPNVILEEKLENTLLEAFLKKEFPDKDYSNALSIGHVDEASQPLDLFSRHHPNGDVLLLSNGKRLLYGPIEIKEQLIKKLNPDTMHNGAYGSLFTGECQNNFQGQVTFLVVEDSNGENGGYLENEQAEKLVGDCHGKVNPIFSKELSNTNNEVIQFRLGNLTDGLYGKGTLAPKELSSYFKDFEVGKQVAFVIPTSSFKGAGKGTVKPGLYTKEVWVGEKEKAQRGEIALSQLLASYPNALKDFIPKLKDHLDKLSTIIQDPRLLAQHYCSQYERREQTKDKTWTPPTPIEAVERYRNYHSKGLNNLPNDDNNEIDQRDSGYEEFLYLALKADPKHHRLLDSKKFTQSLQDFVRKEYLHSAIGKIHKFDRAMILPSKDLKTGEICVPWMEEGENVLNFRSPFLNHNGMLHSTNKYVEDMYAPNGKYLEGVIIVNDEDYSRIVQRTIIEAKAVKPDAELIDVPDKLNKLSVDERIAFTDQLNATLRKAGIDLLVPYESDCERMAADFDGDCLGVAKASHFPHLTQDLIEKSKPENLFRPTRKEDKLSFPEGTDFEVMAIHQADGISVGSINNSVTAFEALLSEQEIYEQYATPALQRQLAQQLIAKAKWALTQEEKEKKPIEIPDFLEEDFKKIASYPTDKPLTAQQVTEVFETQRNIYRRMVEFACYQNQIAVDLFKSARQAEQESVTSLTKLLYRPVDYFKQKKNYNTYRSETIETCGFSPTELTASLVNVQFQENQLQYQPPQQFKNLFPSDYPPQRTLEAKEIKAKYDAAYNLASAYNRKQKLEDDTHLKIATQSGKTLEIVNYKRFLSHSEIEGFNQQTLNLRLVDNRNPKTKHNHQLIAQYQDADKKWKNLGLVCELSRGKFGLRSGSTTQTSQIQIAQSFGKKEVQLLFHQAKQIAVDWRAQLEATKTPEELQQYANATWHLCHNHGNDTTNNFVYEAFGDKILEQISQPDLQFNNFLVGEFPNFNQVPERVWKSNQVLDLQLQLKDGKKVWEILNPETGEYQSFGVASHKEYQLPVGTKVKGKIHGDLFTTARLDINNPRLNETEIVIGNMDKYSKVGYEFRNEPATIVLSQNHHTPPQPLIKVDGKKLGQLDSNAVELFKQHGRLKDNLTFEVTLQSYGQGHTREIVATPQNGTSFKIEKSHFIGHKDLKETQFNGEKVQLTITLEASKKRAMVANVRQPDGSWLPIGEFTSSRKGIESKEALANAGLFREGTTFEAKITSRVTAARIEIEPHSLEYPELGQWQSLSNHATQKAELNPIAKHFVEAITTQPTLLHRFDHQWQPENGTTEVLPTWGLSVDQNRVAATKDFLERHQIPHVLVRPDDPRVSLETERSYGVFWLKESDLSPSIRSVIQQTAHGIYDANFTDVSTVSPYRQRLESIFPLPPPQQQERLENSREVFESVLGTQLLRATKSVQPSNSGQKSPLPIPLIKEFMSQNIILQQQRTAAIAPVMSALLEAKRLDNDPNVHFDEASNTLSFKGIDNSIFWNGEILTLVDNKTGKTKMVAQFSHIDSDGETHWKPYNLPLNSLSLTQQDFDKFTNPKFIHTIKEAIADRICRQQVQPEVNEQTPSKAIVRR